MKLFKVTIDDGESLRDFAVAAVDPMHAREAAQNLGWKVAPSTIYRVEESTVTGGVLRMLEKKLEFYSPYA